LFFFFQAEDGIRDFHVTGVQTCALPILRAIVSNNLQYGIEFRTAFRGKFNFHLGSEFSNVSLKTNELKNHYINNFSFFSFYLNRSEERRVGKECRYRLSTEH